MGHPMATVLAVLVTSIGLVTAKPGDACPTEQMPSDAVALIGYVGSEWRAGDVAIGPFRALVLLREKTIEPTDGGFVRDGMKFWSAVSPSTSSFELRDVSSFGHVVGEDHCVYHAWFRKAPPPPWTLLTSKPLSRVFRRPTQEDRA